MYKDKGRSLPHLSDAEYLNFLERILLEGMTRKLITKVGILNNSVINPQLIIFMEKNPAITQYVSKIK